MAESKAIKNKNELLQIVEDKVQGELKHLATDLLLRVNANKRKLDVEKARLEEKYKSLGDTRDAIFAAYSDYDVDALNKLTAEV